MRTALKDIYLQVKKMSILKKGDTVLDIGANDGTLLSYYKKTFGFKNGVLPIAERIGDSTITLPMYPKMTDSEVKYVIDAFENVL